MIFSVILYTITIAEAYSNIKQCKYNNVGETRSDCYRTYDGSFNNLENPSWGSTFTPYARFLNNSYSDGKHKYPRSITGRELKNARSISLAAFPDIAVDDPIWTLNTVMWGQMIAHDMSLTDKVPQIFNVTTGECCSKAGHIIESDNPKCVPIILPVDDPYNIPEGRKCMNFFRTDTTQDGPESPYEPKTAVTSFIDLSVLYGNSEAEAYSLRSFENGQLKSIDVNNKEYPPIETVKEVCHFKNITKNYCFRTGDVRANQNPSLTFIQIVLLRAHNQIADSLCNSINKHWNDEKCYQEARQILIAIVQHITYYEFLNIILGKQNAYAKKISYENQTGYVNDYNPSVNPSILNEHATAAFRVYHSSIQGLIRLYLQGRKEAGSIRLSDWYDNPSLLLQDDIELKFATGHATQLQGNVDRFINSEVSEFLFRYGKLGLDLITTDITRSRDHGLGTYVSALEKCGLSSPKTFKDLEKFIKPKYVELLMRLYEDVRDVELIVAGFLETLLPNNTSSGPTFNCIMAEQFLRTRVGDRYFFESGTRPCPFTLDQLNSIRESATMASLICNHVDGFDLIQQKAFKAISESNPLVQCNCLPTVDLTLWAEDDSNYYI